MIERGFIIQKTKEYYIKKYIENKLKGVGISHIKLKKIPLGEKIIISTSKPSLIVGSKGSNIRDLTRTLKKDFNLENPQIEINEVKDIYLDASIVADRIAASLERFGSARFKSIGHKMMENVINSGGLGVEILVSGKIPGARAKSWRFYQGYLKKCGDAAIVGVRRAKTAALLKSGIIGIQVSIMPPDLILPDHITILSEAAEVVGISDNVADAEGDKKETKRKSLSRGGKKLTAKKGTNVKRTTKNEKKKSISEDVSLNVSSESSIEKAAENLP